MMALVTCHLNSARALYWYSCRPNGHGENVTGYEQEDVGTNVEQGYEVSGCRGGWVRDIFGGGGLKRVEDHRSCRNL